MAGSEFLCTNDWGKAIWENLSGPPVEGIFSGIYTTSTRIFDGAHAGAEIPRISTRTKGLGEINRKAQEEINTKVYLGRLSNLYIDYTKTFSRAHTDAELRKVCYEGITCTSTFSRAHA